MKILFTKILVLMSLVSFPSWASEIDGKYLNCKCKSNSQNCIDDLVKRGGLYYEKFTDVPFTGDELPQLRDE